jgi:D-alanyl-lipoteichoic acid acyltransferase DltB (MBOAT superfamily)
VAGPIERADQLLPQIERPRRFSWPLARDAMFLILWGYFKKLVIADNAGVIANKVFGLQAPGFTVLWAGVFAFGIQIYADFSAYSDIARGTARWLGVELMRNFDHPYRARTVAEFWHRWHISLSTWFRDYVYIPLGGSRQGRWRRVRNLMATFLLSGLWHGASWNFVLWGAFHGALISSSGPASRRPAPRPWTRWLTPVRILVTFALVNVGWLMFRETDIHFLWRDLTLSPFSASALDRQAGAYLFLVAALYSIPLWLHAIWDGTQPPQEADAAAFSMRKSVPRLVFETAVAGVLFSLLLVFRSRTSLDFIYYQF